MKWLDRMKAAYRMITLSDFPQLAVYLNDNNVAPGIVVNEHTAFSNAAFWNGVNLISSQIATLPRAVYRRISDDDRERDRTQPASRLMLRPNINMTDVVFWETFVSHVLTWGNAYAEIEFDRADRPVALWPITPNRVTPVISGNKLMYRVTGSRWEQELASPEDILHVPGLGYNGLTGYSVIEMARRSLGLSIAAERFGASFFANGARPGIVLQHPKTLSAGAQERIKTTWGRSNGGDRQLGVEVAEEGMEVKSIGIPPDDAQFLETREFQIEEVARWLNISPSKLKSKVGERPGGNLEADQINFLTDTLRPWLIRIEQELNRKLFKPGVEQQRFYIEHNVDAILRVDNASRMQGYKALVDLGVMTADQVAQKENLPKPVDRLAPLPSRIESVGQLIRAGFDPEDAAKALGLPPMKHLGVLPITVQPEDKPAPSGDGGGSPFGRNSKMDAAQRALVADAVGRFVRKEADRVRSAAKNVEGFEEWLESFYEAEQTVLRGYLMVPATVAMAAAGLDGDASLIAGELADSYVRQSKDELLSLPARNLMDSADKLVTRWMSSRPSATADQMLSAIESRRS